MLLENKTTGRYLSAMSEAHRRKKEPEHVRRAIIESAARLAVNDGFASLSMQAVASAAGVTKGGLLHHFPCKQAMVEAVFKEMMAALDRTIDEEMARDTNPRGSFTRAYVSALRKIEVGLLDERGIPISLSMLIDPALTRRWCDWIGDRLNRHAETDGGVDLEIVRLAADGLWLATMCKSPTSNNAEAVINRLIACTR
ncbi:TetR/AcrR family transcriptional regulator [Gemmata obscuriglobus]|nr:TetR/AcrR family transcriptional regulator [Gemmata obscuriglobus]